LRSRWSIPALAAVLYFSEGLPYGIVNETVNLYLAAQGIRLETIGLAGSVGLVWTLKFLWAPLLDTFGTYRAWIVGALLVIAGSVATFALTPAASLGFWIAMTVLAFASATQDIAIDAMTIRLTPEKLLGIVNSVRVASYRVAIIAAGGGIAAASARLGWSGAFVAAAFIPLAVILVVLVTVKGRGSEDRHENPFRALLEWLRRPGAAMLLAVILLYRLGDNTLSLMIRPYWISRGFTAAEVGNVTTTLAMICTIAGAFAGGAFIARYGIFKSLVWLGIAQMASNVVYAIVATTNAGGRSALYTASIVESFTFGLGTAAFLSFVMFICDRENAATEFAALSGLFVLARTIAQSVSGYGAANLGFGSYYWLTAVLAIPGLLLLPLIRERVRGTPATIVTD
jgi:PAT family beta-lactamase induction signal transducer AmpG